MSLRSLNTKLRSLGLRRKYNDLDINFLRDRIREELDGPLNSAGYRSVWHTLKLQGIQVPRETVRVLVSELDPEGVRERRAKALRRRTYRSPGPNFVWHVDGYDKLKPYGFPIHGCIDGYSRKILWLKVSRTNNDPAVTGQHFLDAISKYGGCPTLLRTDNGTENVNMAAIQAFLRCGGEDELAGSNAHRYGSSPANQRIECWWSFLRKNRSNWWINFFRDLIERGDLSTSNDLQKECLWFCFAKLLQDDLNSVTKHWNSHYIRKSRFDTVSGRPDELYFLPECSGAENHIKPVDNDDYQDMSQYCHYYEEDNLFQEYFQSVKEELGLVLPTNWRAALDMFNNLCEIAQR
ncbi:uncharacterized protein LOC114539597 [Dendronephthya gigantea]|uniref:uncharacterized protein LOC114539597 n=1 Tax=Dendronephthya gigantea TaxID=151771 RepID=UPI00106B586D|nr:uncharacterized protein LOC114539597 [Dendronephthya gigantea]